MEGGDTEIKVLLGEELKTNSKLFIFLFCQRKSPFSRPQKEEEKGLLSERCVSFTA